MSRHFVHWARTQGMAVGLSAFFGGLIEVWALPGKTWGIYAMILGSFIWVIEKPFPQSLHQWDFFKSCPARLSFYIVTITPLFLEVGTYCAGFFQLCLIITYAWACYDQESWNVYWIKPPPGLKRSCTAHKIEAPRPTIRDDKKNVMAKITRINSYYPGKVTAPRFQR